MSMQTVAVLGVRVESAPLRAGGVEPTAALSLAVMMNKTLAVITRTVAGAERATTNDARTLGGGAAATTDAGATLVTTTLSVVGGAIEWIPTHAGAGDGSCYRCGGKGHFANVCGAALLLGDTPAPRGMQSWRGPDGRRWYMPDFDWARDRVEPVPLRAGGVVSTAALSLAVMINKTLAMNTRTVAGAERATTNDARALGGGAATTTDAGATLVTTTLS
eukprot:gene7113-259_t